jgi:hypothetical protein
VVDASAATGSLCSLLMNRRLLGAEAVVAVVTLLGSTPVRADQAIRLARTGLEITLPDEWRAETPDDSSDGRLVGGPLAIETAPTVIAAFRPRSAARR